jgi:hypothetical protein
MAKQHQKKRPPYLGNLILAFILATLLFVGIFILGYTISYQKYQGVLLAQEQFRYNLLSFEVERELLEGSCDDFNPYLFSAEMDNMGSVIGILEDRLGKQDPQVLDQKRTYSLLEARHFLYIIEHNGVCNNTIPTILFFYSNEEEYKDEAERVGFMLSSLKKDQEVMIYSFDYDLDSSLVTLLKDKYNVIRPIF